jgi:threonine/homoserine/homoserine lactone efflux protein
MTGTHAFIAGMTLADLLWFTCAATGLAALAQTAYKALAAARARKFFASERALRRLNRSTSAVMASAAVMMAVR